MTMKLEIAAFNLESAIVAYQAGAHRIELCASPFGGGLTPSIGTMQIARQRINIPIFAMIRPREGDFCYTEDEFESMILDIESAKLAGMDGVVFGILNQDGSVDEQRTKLLVETASPMQITFHRAFDMAREFQEAMETIIRCGCHRILSSGGKQTAILGIQNLLSIKQKAEGRIEILPGSGINAENAKTFLKSGFNEIHLSAKINVNGKMKFRKQEPILGGQAFIPDYELQVPDSESIIKVLSEIKE